MRRLLGLACFVVFSLGAAVVVADRNLEPRDEDASLTSGIGGSVEADVLDQAEVRVEAGLSVESDALDLDPSLDGVQAPGAPGAPGLPEVDAPDAPDVSAPSVTGPGVPTTLPSVSGPSVPTTLPPISGPALPGVPTVPSVNGPALPGAPSLDPTALLPNLPTLSGDDFSFLPPPSVPQSPAFALPPLPGGTTTTTTTPAPPPSKPPATSPPKKISTSIVDYTKQPGDQVIVIPNGTYSAGDITTLRSATGGKLGGWLVLVAESPGGVVVDLSKTGMRFLDGKSGGDMRVMFVGLRFSNGVIQMSGVSHVRFWYCDFTFPAQVWDVQWRAAGRPNRGSGMANPLPSAFRIRSGWESGRQASHIGIFGSDLHDLGDDGIFLYSTSNMTVAGVRIWAVDEKGYDPQDWWHNDGIQTSGGAYDMTVTHTYTPRVQWGASFGTIDRGTFTHLWLAGSTSAAWINDVYDGKSMKSQSQNHITSFGNGKHPFRWDIVAGKGGKAWPSSHNDSRLQMTSSNVTDRPPSGVAMDSNGRMADERQAVNHPQNPANTWRKANPYNTWNRYFGFRV